MPVYRFADKNHIVPRSCTRHRTKRPCRHLEICWRSLPRHAIRNRRVSMADVTMQPPEVKEARMDRQAGRLIAVC